MYFIHSCCKHFVSTVLVIAIISIFALADTAWATPATVTPEPNTTATTTDPPRALLDGKELSFEVPPIIENGRTLVPLRAIFEAMGATVQWDQSTQTVTATKGKTVLILPINSTSPTINGVVYSLDIAAKIVNNRTLAPLRFVGETFGGTVNWDETTRTISLSSSKTDDTPTTYQPDNRIKLSSSRDENSVKITMQSQVALTPKINSSNGQVIYAFKGRQVTGTNYKIQAPGSDTMIVQAANDENGSTITFNLPAEMKYSTSRQNNGKTLIVTLPNYIINLQTLNYGNTERIILSTLCPVTYTSQQTGDQVQVTLSNILQGQAQSENDINDQNLESINVTSGDASQPGITLNIAAHNLNNVSFGISGNNNVINIILTAKTAQQGGATSGTTSGTSSAETFYAKYQIAQNYIVNNRPGTALYPSGQVVHSTAGPGATALDIRNYFSNHPEVEASAHVVIDWNSIVEMIPENEKAWHAGPTANRHYLSFEMCEPAANDPDRYNKFQKVWDRAVWYCAKTCIKYGWSTNDNIFSHNIISLTYHETDHTDPYGYFAKYGKTWSQFLAAVDAEIIVLGK